MGYAEGRQIRLLERCYAAKAGFAVEGQRWMWHAEHALRRATRRPIGRRS